MSSERIMLFYLLETLNVLMSRSQQVCSGCWASEVGPVAGPSHSLPLCPWLRAEVAAIYRGDVLSAPTKPPLAHLTQTSAILQSESSQLIPAVQYVLCWRRISTWRSDYMCFRALDSWGRNCPMKLQSSPLQLQVPDAEFNNLEKE